jgi:hypothetical protein
VSPSWLTSTGSLLSIGIVSGLLAASVAVVFQRALALDVPTPLAAAALSLRGGSYRETGWKPRFVAEWCAFAAGTIVGSVVVFETRMNLWDGAVPLGILLTQAGALAVVPRYFAGEGVRHRLLGLVVVGYAGWQGVWSLSWFVAAPEHGSGLMRALSLSFPAWRLLIVPLPGLVLCSVVLLAAPRLARRTGLPAVPDRSIALWASIVTVGASLSLRRDLVPYRAEDAVLAVFAAAFLVALVAGVRTAAPDQRLSDRPR